MRGGREGGWEGGKGGGGKQGSTSQERVDQQLTSISVTMATNDAVRSLYIDKSHTHTHTFIRWPMALAYAFLTAALRSDNPDTRVFRSLPAHSVHIGRGRGGGGGGGGGGG